MHRPARLLALAGLVAALAPCLAPALNIQPIQAEGEERVLQARKRYEAALAQLDKDLQHKQTLVRLVEATDGVKDELNAEARKAYDAAFRQLDYINYEQALEHFIEAAAHEKQRRDLRFLTAELAIFQARKRTGAEALGLLQKAATSYNEIVNMDRATRFEKDRAFLRLEKVKSMIAGQAERDARREKILVQIIEDDNAKAAEERRIRAIKNALDAAKKKKDGEREGGRRRSGGGGRGGGAASMSGG